MAIMFTQPTFKKQSRTEFVFDKNTGLYKGAIEGQKITDTLNAGMKKTCLSCGARTNSTGQLPCGH